MSLTRRITRVYATSEQLGDLYSSDNLPYGINGPKIKSLFDEKRLYIELIIKSITMGTI